MEALNIADVPRNICFSAVEKDSKAVLGCCRWLSPGVLHLRDISVLRCCFVKPVPSVTFWKENRAFCPSVPSKLSTRTHMCRGKQLCVST